MKEITKKVADELKKQFTEEATKKAVKIALEKVIDLADGLKQKEFNTNSKYILDCVEGENSLNRNIGYLTLIFWISIILFMFIFDGASLTQNLSISILFIPLIILSIYLIFKSSSYIEINKGKIYKKFIFKRKIATLSDITGFYEVDDGVIVESNDKDLFYFEIPSTKNNQLFYNWLKKKYENCIIVKGNTILQKLFFTTFIYGLLIIIYFLLNQGISNIPLSTIFILIIILVLIPFVLGINEEKKLFKVENNIIVKKNLFKTSIYKIEDITSTKVKSYESSDVYSKILYKMEFYKNNKILFTQKGINISNLELIKEGLYTENINIKK